MLMTPQNQITKIQFQSSSKRGHLLIPKKRNRKRRKMNQILKTKNKNKEKKIKNKSQPHKIRLTPNKKLETENFKK